MSPAEFEPAIPASDGPQTHALHCADTWRRAACLTNFILHFVTVTIWRVYHKTLPSYLLTYLLIDSLTYLLTNAMEQSPSWEANRFSASQEILLILWNPESSSPHLQVPATCPYPEPDQSSPCPHPTSSRSILILSSHLRLVLTSGLFPWVFPHQNPVYTFPSYVLHVPPIALFSIWSPKQYFMRSTDQ